MKRKPTRRACAIALLCSAVLLGLPGLALILRHESTSQLAHAQDMSRDGDGR